MPQPWRGRPEHIAHEHRAIDQTNGFKELALAGPPVAAVYKSTLRSYPGYCTVCTIQYNVACAEHATEYCVVLNLTTEARTFTPMCAYTPRPRTT